MLTSGETKQCIRLSIEPPNVQGNWAAASCLKLKTTAGRRLQLTELVGRFL